MKDLPPTKACEDISEWAMELAPPIIAMVVPFLFRFTKTFGDGAIFFGSRGIIRRSFDCCVGIDDGRDQVFHAAMGGTIHSKDVLTVSFDFITQAGDEKIAFPAPTLNLRVLAAWV